jgi:putative copper resistance protein D
LAAVGHPGATPGLKGIFLLTSDALHVVGAGTWVGGLCPLALLLAVARREADIAATASRRFSILGIATVATILLTSIINAWVLVGSFDALLNTDYGRLLSLKICFFVAMVCITAFNRTRLLAWQDALDSIQRNSLIEAGLGLLAIFIAGALGTIPPAAHMHIEHMH